MVRNRIKRRLREAVLDCEAEAGIDVVISGDGSVAETGFQELVGELRGALAATRMEGG